MKKILLTILVSFTFMFAFPQTESSENKQVLARFEGYYNAGQYDSVFSIFSKQAKIALPFERTHAFFSKLKSRYGNITKRSFLEYKAAYSIYITEFERGILSLSIEVDTNKAIAGLFVKPYELDTLPKLQRNTTKMKLPFKEEWTVFWGGDTKELNHHTGVKFQKNAFDIVITDKQGKTFKTEGKTNEDYYAFGMQLIAPCEGEIVFAVDGINDNIPGTVNPFFILGNSIILKTKNDEYILFAHFKQGSIKVKQGDVVKQGQLLGLCGNSGNSSEPHLHFHIQNVEDLNKATGAKCFFENILVNGVQKSDYSPIKGDRIQNIKE